MSRVFWAGALLLVACGGSDAGAVFGDSGQGGGMAQGGALSGAAGSIDVPDRAGASTAPGGTAGVVGVAGGGAASTGGNAQAAGDGGAEEPDPVAGAAHGGSSGGGQGGSLAAGAGAAGKGGAQQGGAAGSGGAKPLMCDEGTLDCDHSAANDCEIYFGEHDHCGSCDNRCGVTQKCVTVGSAGDLNAYCTSK